MFCFKTFLMHVSLLSKPQKLLNIIELWAANPACFWFWNIYKIERVSLCIYKCSWVLGSYKNWESNRGFKFFLVTFSVLTYVVELIITSFSCFSRNWKSLCWWDMLICVSRKLWFRWVFWAKIWMRPRNYDNLEILVTNFWDLDSFNFLLLFQPKMAKIQDLSWKSGRKLKIKISKMCY